MTTINNLPQPATHYPFKPGEAVYYLRERLSCHATKQPALMPAIVLEGTATPGRRGRITIWCKDEQRICVQGNSLVYQGYCAFCGVPAVLGADEGSLICPRCGEMATTVPPPPELTLRWYPLGRDSYAQATRECVLRGCGWDNGMDAWRTRHHGAWALLRKHGMTDDVWARRGPWGLRDADDYAFFENRMLWYAELDDEASFLAYYRAHGGVLPIERDREIIALLDAMLDGDGPGRASQRIVLLPLDFVRPAADSEPDGTDELTTWLDRQFKHAA